MEKYIDVTKEVRQKAMKVFDVTERSLMNALKFDSQRGNSDKAKRIRQYAWQNGGVTMVVSKEVETIHDCDGYMRQYFPKGAIMEIDKKSGDASIYFNGEKIVSFENVFVWQLDLLQEVAGKMKASDVGKFAEPAFVERWKRGITECWRDKYIKNEEQRAKGKEFSYPRIKS